MELRACFNLYQHKGGTAEDGDGKAELASRASIAFSQEANFE